MTITDVIEMARKAGGYDGFTSPPTNWDEGNFVISPEELLKFAALVRRAPHPAITHCDNCGCDWLDNGLNPVGCPYCKQSEQAAEVDALRAEVERLRGLVVSRFDQDSPPTFRQGTPEHELEDPVTAEQCAWFVAEIKRLRTENERLHEQLRLATVDQAIAEAEASDAHAENKRLAEALALLPDEIVMIEHNPDEGPLMFCCGRKVKLSWLHDLIPTHDKDCWYARMRALLSAVERDAPEVAL